MSDSAIVEKVYEIVESPQFTESVRQTFHGTRLRRELRTKLLRELGRNPLHPKFWNNGRKIGIVELIVPPRLAVWFIVNEDQQKVICTGLGLAL